MKLTWLLHTQLLVLARMSTYPRVSFLDAGGIGVSWQSAIQVSCSRLQYGLDVKLGSMAEASRDCDLYKGDTIHHVTLGDLKVYTKYYYRIECDPVTYSFTTAQTSERVESFAFGVYGDLGPLNGERTLAALHALRDSLSGHIFAGDIGYADDAFFHGEGYISRTNAFLDQLSESSAYVPVMVAPGNHEAEDHTPVCLLSPSCREGLGNFTAYNCIWNMPSPRGRHSMWSSFDYGPIHFVMTNTETDYDGAPLEPYGEVGFIPTGKFGAPGEYLTWLREDLEQAESQRHVRPWVIVVGHRPITVLDGEIDPFQSPLSNEIIDLIGTHADVYISGHVHYYARSIPKENSPFQAVLVSVGGAGCDEWPERVLQTTVSGETTWFDYFGYGDEQTFALLRFTKERPDELVFEVQSSLSGKTVDRIAVPKRKRTDTRVPVIITQ